MIIFIILKLLVLSDQQFEIQRYIIHHDIRTKKYSTFSTFEELDSKNA